MEKEEEMRKKTIMKSGPVFSHAYMPILILVQSTFTVFLTYIYEHPYVNEEGGVFFRMATSIYCKSKSRLFLTLKYHKLYFYYLSPWFYIAI